jgi:hypothetical protein
MNALIYTVKNDPRHLADLALSLKSVKDCLIPFTKQLDILFFFDHDTMKEIESIIWNLKIENRVFYIPFVANPPAWADKKDVWLKYKNMCRFWAGEIFRHPKVLEYDYYMRLDCDSSFKEPIGYDPFEMMKKEDKDYAFLTGGKFLDTVPYFEGLNSALQEFEVQYVHPGTRSLAQIIKNTVDSLQEGTLYYTNFEIVRVKAFSESLYMNLFDHIERVGGIYKHRWGDHIIRYAGIHLLIGFDRVKEISDMRYFHQGFYGKI